MIGVLLDTQLLPSKKSDDGDDDDDDDDDEFTDRELNLSGRFCSI